MDKKQTFRQFINVSENTKEKLFYSSVYLFSTKGYANVGIREISHSVSIKPSSFYNHYPSKEALFKEILVSFRLMMKKVVFTKEEIEQIADEGDISAFFMKNMERFRSVTGNPLFHTLLQIINMESYTNPEAYELAAQNLYYLRKDYTEKVLKKMMEKGHIKPCDPAIITSEYYYTLKGLLDEYLLREVWDKDTSDIMLKIKQHIEFFTSLLKPERGDDS